MAFPTAVNSQITDSVTQANTKVLGDSPAQALSTLYQNVAQSMAMAAQNAVAQQQNGHSIASAVTTRCIESLLGQAPRG